MDALGEAGIARSARRREAARIEGSKTYAKELMRDAACPPPRTRSSATARRRAEHLACASYPAVLKADVLAAGKGVIIAADEREAREAVEQFFTERRFGETEVVLEEFLDGEELSLLALCDGERARAAGAGAGLQARSRRGRRARTPAAWAATRPCRASTAKHAEVLARASHQPIVDELRRRGTPYHGVLYAGLMMTADGPRVLEFNCRFGDPETQAVLPRLRSRSARPAGGAPPGRAAWPAWRPSGPRTGP